eukprot:scaffold651490_cov52-Prasinocladus_malaysianus.AAC.1
MEVHVDHLVAGLQNAVDKLADAEKLDLLALPGTDGSALAEGAGADADHAVAGRANASLLAGTPTAGHQAQAGCTGL